MNLATAFSAIFRSIHNAAGIGWRALSLAVVPLLLAFPIDSLATSCSPVAKGFLIAAVVTFFEHDTSTMPPKRRETTVARADPGTFEPLPSPRQRRGPCSGRNVEYGKDRNHVYHRSQIIAGADPKTFNFIDDDYARDKSAVYAKARPLTQRVASFRILDGGYATDGRLYFFGDIPIVGHGFELLQGSGSVNTGYAKTHASVYHNGQVVAHADPRTFEIFKSEVGMARDRRNVYFEDRVIPGADPGTIVQIQGYAFKDKDSVYIEGRKVAGLKPASVRASEFGTYLMDDRIVVRNGVEIQGRDSASFRELQSPWTLDKNGVYYQDELVPEIDSVTFTTNALNRGEDRSYRYEGLTKVCRFGNGPIQSLPACS